MSIEENKALVRRFYEEVRDRGNVEFAQEVFADEYLRHDLRPTTAAPGPQGQRQIAAAFRAAFARVSVGSRYLVTVAERLMAQRARPGSPRAESGTTVRKHHVTPRQDAGASKNATAESLA